MLQRYLDFGSKNHRNQSEKMSVGAGVVGAADADVLAALPDGSTVAVLGVPGEDALALSLASQHLHFSQRMKGWFKFLNKLTSVHQNSKIQKLYFLFPF